MVDLPFALPSALPFAPVVDGTQTQTCVSRTGARVTAPHLKPDGRGVLMLGPCFMFQTFQTVSHAATNARP
jgi:hypothetical protein